MVKSIGFIGSKGFIHDAAFKSTEELMKAVGNNTGNLVFQHAVFNMLSEEKLVLGVDLPWNDTKIRERCRLLVVPSANFIREGVDMSPMVDFLDKIGLPLVFIGLGAQAEDYNKAEFDFHPSIHRLLALIRERSKRVSIRGEFTGRVLERFGIAHTELTGCPSNFINPSADLPDLIAQKLQRPMRSFITHGDELWPRSKSKQIVERRLASWTRQGVSIQSQQSVPKFMDYVRRNNSFAGVKVAGDLEESSRSALMPEATLEEFREFVAVKQRVYVSVSQWMEDSSKFDFSIGLRLHGNMAAWQSGTPALWIYHDSRTQELAETMALPRISVDDFVENCPKVEDAWQRVGFDKEAYRSRRTLLAHRMASVLASESILHNLEGIDRVGL